MKTTRRTDHVRAIELASYHRRVNRFRRLKLNSRGNGYRRTPNLPAHERAAHYRKVTLAKYHRRTARRADQHLTSRGQMPAGRRKLATLLQGAPIAVQLRRAW